MTGMSVFKWKRRFLELRLDGLSEEQRRGRPAGITAAPLGDPSRDQYAAQGEDLLERERSGWGLELHGKTVDGVTGYKAITERLTSSACFLKTAGLSSIVSDVRQVQLSA